MHHLFCVVFCIFICCIYSSCFIVSHSLHAVFFLVFLRVVSCHRSIVPRSEMLCIRGGDPATTTYHCYCHSHCRTRMWCVFEGRRAKLYECRLIAIMSTKLSCFTSTPTQPSLREVGEVMVGTMGGTCMPATMCALCLSSTRGGSAVCLFLVFVLVIIRDAYRQVECCNFVYFGMYVIMVPAHRVDGSWRHMGFV